MTLKTLWTFTKNILQTWYGKTRVTSYELRVASYELRVTSWKLKSTSWNSKCQVQIHELQAPICESLNQWIICTYLVTNFSTPPPLYAPVHILDDPTQFPQLRAYLIDGLFLNQKTNKNVRKPYLQKYKHPKKNSLRKNKWLWKIK